LKNLLSFGDSKVARIFLLEKEIRMSGNFLGVNGNI